MNDRMEPLDSGVWGVVPTPFMGANLELDAKSLASAVDFYKSAGATGLVVLGVFGEAASLADWERAAALKTAAEAAGDTPLVVGVPALATAAAAAQGQAVLEGLPPTSRRKIVGLLVQLNSESADVVCNHVDTIAGTTGVGVVLQNYPASSGVTMQPSQIRRVVELSSNIVAIKEERPPTPLGIAALAGIDVPIFGGLGGVGLIDELAAGAAGAMTGFSHPEGLVAAVSSFHAEGFQAARKDFSHWLPIANFEGQPGLGLAIRKEILRRRGVIAQSGVRAPARSFPDLLSPLVDWHLAALAKTERTDR